MTKDEAIKWLRTKVSHYECEDCWYSCATITCDENRRSSICDCGADQENSISEQVAALLEGEPSGDSASPSKGAS